MPTCPCRTAASSRTSAVPGTIPPRALNGHAATPTTLQWLLDTSLEALRVCLTCVGVALSSRANEKPRRWCLRKRIAWPSLYLESSSIWLQKWRAIVVLSMTGRASPGNAVERSRRDMHMYDCKPAKQDSRLRQGFYMEHLCHQHELHVYEAPHSM